MAYQNPSYSFLHAAASAGVGALTASPAADSDYPLDNLIDYRPSSLFKFSGSGSIGKVDVDRGAPGLEVVTRIIIPAGHNLATATDIDVRAGDDGASFGTILLEAHDQSAESDPDGILYQDLNPNQQRYLRFVVQTPATGTTWEYPQLFLTRKRTPTVGIDPRWTAAKVSSTMRIPFPSRDATLSTAPDRWFYRVAYNAVSGTDLDIFDELFEETGSGLVPFYFDPPDDGAVPILMAIQGQPVRRQDGKSPSGAGGATYRIEFDMLEQSG